MVFSGHSCLYRGNIHTLSPSSASNIRKLHKDVQTTIDSRCGIVVGYVQRCYNIYARAFLLTSTQHPHKFRPSLSNVEQLAIQHSTTSSSDQALEVSQLPTSFQKVAHRYFSSSVARPQLDSGTVTTDLNGWTTLA